MVRKSDNIVSGMISDDQLRRPQVVAKKKETRSARQPVYTTPTLKKRFLAKCSREDISANEVINQLIENWVNE